MTSCVLQVSSFRQPSTAVTVNPDRGLTWSLSGARISLHGDWRVKYRIFFEISDRGSFDASASGASISVSATLGSTASGEPTIRATKCTCYIDRLKIYLQGGASWLYNLFMVFVEGGVRHNLQVKICDAAKDAVNSDAARELATAPMRILLGHDKQWMLDYRLVSSPAFKSGYLESFHKGEFFSAGDLTEAPFQPSPLPSPPTADRMATFWASSYVLNTAGYVFQKRGVLRYNVTRENLSKKSRDLLSTSCSYFICIGAFVRAVGKKFPNAFVELEMFSSSAPMVEIDTQKLTGNFAGVVVFWARLPDGSLEQMFVINVTAKITVAPRLDGNVLKAKVISMENTLTVIGSNVGPISIPVLEVVFDVVKNTFIIPKLNEAGEMGIPLPALKHAQFINTGLQLEHDCVQVSTDVKYSPTA